MTVDLAGIGAAVGQVAQVGDVVLTPGRIYTQEQLDQAVADGVLAQRLLWDAAGDGHIGLAEAIRALQIVAGISLPY